LFERVGFVRVQKICKQTDSKFISADGGPVPPATDEKIHYDVVDCLALAAGDCGQGTVLMCFVPDINRFKADGFKSLIFKPKKALSNYVFHMKYYLDQHKKEMIALLQTLLQRAVKLP